MYRITVSIVCVFLCAAFVQAQSSTKAAEDSLKSVETLMKKAQDRVEKEDKRVQELKDLLPAVRRLGLETKASLRKVKKEHDDEAPYRSGLETDMREEIRMLKKTVDGLERDSKSAALAADRYPSYSSIDRLEEVTKSYQLKKKDLEKRVNLLKRFEDEQIKADKSFAENIGKVDEQVKQFEDDLRTAETARLEAQKVLVGTMELYKSAQLLLGHVTFPIEEVRQRLDDLSGKIDELGRNVATGRDVGKLKEQIAAMNKELGVELRTIRTDVRHIKSDVASNTAEIALLRKDVCKVLTEFSDIKVRTQGTAEATAMLLNLYRTMSEMQEADSALLKSLQTKVDTLLADCRKTSATLPARTPCYRLVQYACGRWYWVRVEE